VVSEWCQYYLRIRVTLPSTSNYSQSRLATLCVAPLTGEPEEEPRGWFSLSV
jgi:hypothetical protein